MTTTNLISRRLLVGLAAGALSLAACSSGGTPAASSGAGATVGATAAAGGCTPSATVGTPNVAAAIADFSFNPAAITVAKGGTVTWTNGGGATHTVTADEGGFDSCNMAGGATFTMKFDTAGTIAFHCKIHSSMKGTVTVTG